MLFYKIMFVLFQSLFYFCVGSFAVLLAGMICGLVKPVDMNIAYQACALLIILSPICKLVAKSIHQKTKLLRLKGEG